MREPGWDRGAYEAYGGYDAPPGAPRHDAPPGAPQSSEAGRRLDPTYAARPSPPIAPPGRPPGYAPAPPPPPMPGRPVARHGPLGRRAAAAPRRGRASRSRPRAAYVTGVPVDMRGDRLRRAFECTGLLFEWSPCPYGIQKEALDPPSWSSGTPNP